MKTVLSTVKTLERLHCRLVVNLPYTPLSMINRSLPSGWDSIRNTNVTVYKRNMPVGPRHWSGGNPHITLLVCARGISFLSSLRCLFAIRLLHVGLSYMKNPIAGS